jgi:hypothetical protein
MFEALKHWLVRIGTAAAHAGLWWGIAISLGLGLASLAVAAAVVVSWPPDHFRSAGRAGLWHDRPPVVRALGLAMKNVAGAALLVLGALMALPGIPGQGILTMIIGLTLVDFPGKVRLERRLISRPSVLSRLNRLRARFHRAALQLD